ncbi:hypothetical protein ATOBIA_N04310 [Atopobiaceae bacterium P1]|uniref:Uncharacterized protein n=1 Tax=Leptogranulimonas caecicola TaxID=2894156 RepID=A0AAU9CEQ4_9ACTN|nr:hypothetical protein ATOBIA_N04310 [Atopobiaceae bacterium P1]BDC90546.1 hypothetical protein ATTO_04180 [Leptogranulimonas caecicola]
MVLDESDSLEAPCRIALFGVATHMGPSCIWQLWACFLSYLPVFGHAGIVKDASQ